MVSSIIKAVTLLTAASRFANALDLDVTSTSSIKDASSVIAKNIIGQYNDFQKTVTQSWQVGTFAMPPNYWWTGAVAWGALIDYRTYTGDHSYDDTVTKGLIAQIGPDKDYMPREQTKDEGNDDQAFWALACMDALEYGLPNASNATWLQLAEAVFNVQTARWDNETCNGGLRWQIFSFNAGYSYKNVESNGALFQLSARLARYTGNETYAAWANKTYDWMRDIGLITSAGAVYDGTDATSNCSSIDHVEWTINSGLIMYGAAIMYNITDGKDLWRARLDQLTYHALDIFTVNTTGILTEQACESNSPVNCNTDQLLFKGLFARWFVKSKAVASHLQNVEKVIQSSAQAAASTCGDGSMCQTKWYSSENDTSSSTGTVAQELSALAVIQSSLVVGNNAVSVKPMMMGESSGTGNSTTGGSSPPSNTSTGGSPAYTGTASSYSHGSIAGVVLMVALAFAAL